MKRLTPLSYIILGFIVFTSLVMVFRSIQIDQKSENSAKKRMLLAKFAQEIKMTKDPSTGFVPKERLIEARSYVKKILSNREKAAIPEITWNNVGPNNVGGRTRAILFDPNDINHKAVFAGGVSGGLWKNNDITNPDSSWHQINDFLENLAISVIAADPNNPQILYAGTGEAYTQVTPGLGIFKSTDGGDTWSQLNSTTGFRYITDMVVRNEAGTSVLYVATKSIYLEGLDDYLGFDLLVRSNNGGSTWDFDVLDEEEAIDDIEIDASNNLWITFGENSYGEYGGDIYTCQSNCDNPNGWTKKYDASNNGHSTVERTIIATAPSGADTIYAVAANSSGKEDIEYFIKSTDGGDSWSNLTIPMAYDLDNCSPEANTHFTLEQGTYDLIMAVHPSDADIVLLGGIDLYRTINGFSTTQHIGSWYEGNAPCNQYIHADHHAILFRPNHSNEVIFGNDGGVFYSNNAGDKTETAPSFSHHVKEYNVSQLYAADISPNKGAAEYLGGLQDNGTQDWDQANGQSTSEADGGDGGWCHIDQNESDIQIASYIYNQYSVTTDEWVTRTQVSTAESGEFINPTDYDDVNNILYGATGRNMLSKITGVGTTNSFVDSISISGSKLVNSTASTIRVDRNNPTTIYVGTANGRIVKIDNANGGSLSSSIISSGIPTNTWISSIDVELGNSQHMLATISNYGVVSVWETLDGGTSWQSIEGNLPDMPIRWGIFSPANSDQALLATDLGIWSTDNIDGTNTQWNVTNTGLANVRVDMLRWRSSDSTVVAATHGRGLYTYSFGNSMSNDCQDLLTVSDDNPINNYKATILVQSDSTKSIVVNDSAFFKSGQDVLLNKNFSVSSGAKFEAIIEDCQN